MKKKKRKEKKRKEKKRRKEMKVTMKERNQVRIGIDSKREQSQESTCCFKGFLFLSFSLLSVRD